MYIFYSMAFLDDSYLLGGDSQRFLSKNSYLSTTFVVIFMLYLSKNWIFVNPGPD